jgi:hypothetical protein
MEGHKPRKKLGKHLIPYHVAYQCKEDKIDRVGYSGEVVGYVLGLKPPVGKKNQQGKTL